MVDTEKAPSGNRIKLILFLIFAGLIFYQFFGYAQKFSLTDLLLKSSGGPTILYGVARQDFATSQSPAGFDPLILILALNIALWIERPDRVGRVPLIIIFVTSLSIMILRVGIAAPALKLAEAAPQTDIQNTWNLAALHAKWNTVYLVLATFSAVMVLGMLIYFLQHDESASGYVSRVTGRFHVRNTTFLTSKIKFVLFLIFAILTFYQFVSYVNSVRRIATQPPVEINIPAHSDVAVTTVTSVNSFSRFIPFILLLALNVVVWVIHPQSIGRVSLTLTLIANLSIFVIRDNIAEAALKRSLDIPWLTTKDVLNIIRLHAAQWNNVYLLLASISALVVVGMVIQVWRKR
jgi:hypothetical protein